jgi:hypothetical protein
LHFGFFLVLQASDMPFPKKMQSLATSRERNREDKSFFCKMPMIFWSFEGFFAHTRTQPSAMVMFLKE